MDGLTKPAITRLARRAGVKSLSDDCFESIYEIIDAKLREVVHVASALKAGYQTKTVQPNDIYEALQLMNNI